MKENECYEEGYRANLRICLFKRNKIKSKSLYFKYDLLGEKFDFLYFYI